MAVVLLGNLWEFCSLPSNSLHSYCGIPGNPGGTLRILGSKTRTLSSLGLTDMLILLYLAHIVSAYEISS